MRSRPVQIEQFARCAIAISLVALSESGCGGGASPTASVPTPPPVRGHRQLKTPTNPPAAIFELADYALPAPDPDQWMPGIVWGPDQNVWASEPDGNKIARITPQGQITEFPVLTPGAQPWDLAVGPDGNIWISETSADTIARLTIASGVVDEFVLPPSYPVINGEGPRGIKAGPDGNIWFTMPDSSLIGRMSPAGVLLNTYTVPTPASGNTRLTVGPDGNIWFTESYVSKVGQLVIATGAINEWPTPTSNSYPDGLATGADGNIWFDERDASQIGRITPAGTITEFATPSKIARPLYMTSTPDGSLWFAEESNNGICRVDPVNLTFVEYQGNGVYLQGDTAGAGSSTTWFTDGVNDAVVEFGPASAARVAGHLHRVKTTGPANR